MTSNPPPAFAISGTTVAPSGSWTAESLQESRPAISPKSFDRSARLNLDLSGLQHLDTFGAAALADMVETLRYAGLSIDISNVNARHNDLIESFLKQEDPEAHDAPLDLTAPLSALGKTVVDAGNDASDIVDVLGHIIWSTFNIFTLRGPVRPAAIANQFQDIVLKAIPIVALISLVVGIILTQQSIAQLKNFGATIFVVDLGGILMLREIGVLLAAIMVAGRSGSAITAEIGAMKMREEIDALEVMGLDTYRSVIMPRALALVFGMPALGLVGAISGIIGAALVARIMGGISLETFGIRLADVVDLQVIMVGVVKAPFMALAIAVIATAEGLRVSGSTQSLGRHTTASVVKSIFIVIVIDGVFAIFFEAIGF